MNIQLNGNPITTQAQTVETLVAELKLNPKQVAIERNGVIVPRSTYASTHVAAGEVIEVVAFVGGG